MADGRGAGTAGVELGAAGVADAVGWGFTVAVAVAAGTIWPDSMIRAIFSFVISISILPFEGGGGGATCFPFSII